MAGCCARSNGNSAPPQHGKSLVSSLRQRRLAAVSGHLRECGFKVIEASSADEAMRMLRSDFPVDVVFIGLAGSDNPDGFEVAQWIHRERPSIKVSLAAGLGRTVKEAEHLCEHGPMLRKPYDHQELKRHIRHLLAQ